MKTIRTILFMTAMITTLSCSAQKNDEKAVKETVTAFVRAGDENQADKLATYLDDNFRIVMNRLFGSKEVSIVPREVYLNKIRSGEWGGDPRQPEFMNVWVYGTTAQAAVKLTGAKMTFISLYTLVKGENGSWKIVSDAPVIM